MGLSFFQRLDLDLAKTIAALGQSFNFAGTTIPCGLTRSAAGNDPMEGGSWDVYSGAAFTRRIYFDNATPTPIAIPVQGQQMIVDGKTVFIQHVKSDAAAPLVTIYFASNPPPR